MSEHTPISVPTIRHDGWTPGRRIQFLDHLAGRGNVRAACAHVRMSAEAAYRLRRRDAGFARAWNTALALAREACADELGCRAIDGIEEDVWRGGEVVGTRRKYDTRLLLAHLGPLDKLVEETPAGEDVHRFDELLAVAAGAEVPPEMRGEDEVLPVTREEHCDAAVESADLDAMFEKHDVEHAEGEDLAALEAELAPLLDEARTRAGAEWDEWRASALALVDQALAAPAGEAEGTPSTSSTSLPASEGRAPCPSPGMPHSALIGGLLGPNPGAFAARA